MINLFFPIPAEYLQSYQQLFFLEGRTVWFSLFIIALLPGICEEILFRGYFIRAFQDKGFMKSIIISAVLFGVLHLDVYRFLPVTVLGVWMGYIVLKTNSIFIPMIAHAANNAIAYLMVQYGEYFPLEKIIIDGENLNWWLAIPSIVLLVVLIKIFNKLNLENENVNVKPTDENLFRL